APGNAAEEGEGPRMGVEQHLLALARIGPDIRRTGCAQADMRDLHPHRLAGDLYVLVAPVELIRLAGLERHRDEGQCVVASVLAPLLPPAARIAADGIVGTLE